MAQKIPTIIGHKTPFQKEPLLPSGSLVMAETNEMPALKCYTAFSYDIISIQLLNRFPTKMQFKQLQIEGLDCPPID